MNLRIGILVTGVLLAASSATAQQLATGIAAGATYSDFENPDTESRWGFSGGLLLGVSTVRSLSLLEVSYTQKGDSDVRIDYIEVGINGGAVVGSPSGARGRFYGGVQVAFPIACEGTTVVTTAFCDETVVEWGGPLGLMLGRFTSGGSFFGLDVRYTFPFSDAGLEVWNNVWTFRVILGRIKQR